MSNLYGPPSHHVSSQPVTDQRPYHIGQLEGTISQNPMSVLIEWLVDTGAQVSVVTQAIGTSFDLQPSYLVGVSAMPTTGGTGISLYSGLTVVFHVKTGGGSRTVKCNTLDVGVKSNNDGGELLGMDQIASAAAKVLWDPSANAGDIHD